MRVTTPAKTASMLVPFNRAQRVVLDALMDLLIPASRDGRMPAARTLGLYNDVSAMRPAVRALFDAGLADLDERALRAHGVPFARVESVAAQRIVDGLRHEASAFIQGFMTQTAGRYVAHPVVMPLIGLEARPMWPKGNVVAEGDWSLLDGVKRREKFYRKV